MRHPVTDHALIRYLERVHDIDMDFFRKACLNECREALKSGASSARIGDHYFIFEDGKVITVLDRNVKPKHLA